MSGSRLRERPAWQALEAHCSEVGSWVGIAPGLFTTAGGLALALTAAAFAARYAL